MKPKEVKMASKNRCAWMTGGRYVVTEQCVFEAKHAGACRFELVEAAKPTTCGVELLNGETCPQTPDHRGPHGPEPAIRPAAPMFCQWRIGPMDDIRMCTKRNDHDGDHEFGPPKAPAGSAIIREASKQIDELRAQVAIERQRANRLGDEAGSNRAELFAMIAMNTTAKQKVADLESQARTDARTILGLRERCRKLERR